MHFTGPRFIEPLLRLTIQVEFGAFFFLRGTRLRTLYRIRRYRRRAREPGNGSGLCVAKVTLSGAPLKIISYVMYKRKKPPTRASCL